MGQIDATIEHTVHVGPQPEPRGDAPRVRDHQSRRIANVMRWPADSHCEGLEVPLAPDASLFELSPGAVLATFDTSLPVRWEDGSETTLELIPAAVGGACLSTAGPTWTEPFDLPAYEPEAPMTVDQPIELSIATADGRFSGQVELMLQIKPNHEGGLEHAWLSTTVDMAAGDTGGWSGVSADPSQERMWRLQVVHTPPAALSGELTLYGFQMEEPCAKDERPCLGLPGGGIYRPLLRAKTP